MNSILHCVRVEGCVIGGEVLHCVKTNRANLGWRGTLLGEKFYIVLKQTGLI